MGSCISAPAPALLYHGSKWRLSAWIQSFFPPHFAYVEPFCGSLAVLLSKPPAQVEIANDLDEEVVNFFTVLRTRTADLVEQIKCTPYSRIEFSRSFERHDDALERARRLYVRSWMGYGVKLGRWRTGFKISRDPSGPNVVKRWTRIEHLWILAERLRSTLIECLPATEVIKKYDSPRTLYYLDPPYLPDTRSKWWRAGYTCDMSEQDHVDLARVLHTVQGMVAISGYPSDLYRELYPHWHMVTTSARNVRNQIVTEGLWLSPSISQHLSVPTLFDPCVL